jgi:anti-sigma B factor antagonist
MKEFGDERISKGEKCLVVDLHGCTGMDSTFMGTLAGMAARLSNQEGTLQIADAGSRNRRSLEDLGLDFLMDIDPPQAAWRGKVDLIRQFLNPPDHIPAPDQLERAKQVLEAHQLLAETNDKNAQTFSNVVAILEAEVAEKQRLANRPESQ